MKTLMLLALAASAPAVDAFRIDQPADWYKPEVSHHGKHGLGGVAIGAFAFEADALITDDRRWRYATAIAAGTVAGFGYEAYHADATTYNDPVDALWVVAGSVVGAALADATNHVASFIVTPDRTAAVELSWRF